MRFSKALPLLLLLTTAMAGSAKQVTPGDAELTARNYLSSNAPRRVHGVNRATPQLTLKHVARDTDNQPSYYAFDNGRGNGFIIVAGDDRAVPVLGYSDSGSFDPACLPDGLQCLLEGYSREIAYLRSHPEAAKAQAPTVRNAVVLPLLTCNWDQKDPFNRMCPQYEDNGVTITCATGCVATAAAQIMYYHKWPVRGTGSNSYEWTGHDGQEIWADFNHTYDWDNMIDNYVEGSFNDTQANAVAQLMFDAGVAAGMSYGKSSSTSAYWMMTALRENFGYSKSMKMLMRNTMTLAQWEDLIFGELNAGRPILYSGFTTGGGHSFVLDGYNADGYFHFNWGWSSLSNGYFLITALNPREQGTGSYEGGYNDSQTMIVNISPQNGEQMPASYLMVTCTELMPASNSVELGQTVAVNLNGLMGSGMGYGNRVDITYAYVLTDNDDKIVEIYREQDLSMKLGTRYTHNVSRKNAFTITPGATLQDGDYRLWLMYKCETAGVDDYRPYDHSPLTAGYVVAHVENGTMTFTKPKVGNPQLKVASFEYPEFVGDNSFFNAKLIFTNSGDEFYGNIHVAIKDNAEPEKGFVNHFTALVDVVKGQEVPVQCTIFPPRGVGNFEMVVRDDDGNIIDGPRTLVIKESDGYQLEAATPLSAESYYMYWQDIKANVELLNSGEKDFVGTIHFEIDQNGHKKGSGYSDVVVIPAGEKRVVNFKTELEGQPGLVYDMMIFNVKRDTDEEKERITTSFMLLDDFAGTSVKDMLELWQVGQSYTLTDNLTIVDALEPSLFVSDGNDNWLEINDPARYSKLVAMGAFKAGTTSGTLSERDGNPLFELAWMPQQGMKQDIEILKLDPAGDGKPASQQVVEVEGAYSLDGDRHVLRPVNVRGQGVEVSFEWLSTPPLLTVGERCLVHGVAQYVSDDEFVVYSTREPQKSTGITAVAGNGVGVSQNGGVVTVSGAARVAIYTATGALVSTGATAVLPRGVYIVVADGVSRKIAVN